MCEINSPPRFHAALTPPARVERDENGGVRKERRKAIKLEGYYIPAKVRGTLLAGRFGSFQTSFTRANPTGLGCNHIGTY